MALGGGNQQGEGGVERSGCPSWIRAELCHATGLGKCTWRAERSMSFPCRPRGVLRWDLEVHGSFHRGRCWLQDSSFSSQGPGALRTATDLPRSDARSPVLHRGSQGLAPAGTGRRQPIARCQVSGVCLLCHPSQVPRPPWRPSEAGPRSSRKLLAAGRGVRRSPWEASVALKAFLYS